MQARVPPDQQRLRHERVSRLTIHPARFAVSVDERPVTLTYKEFELLSFLFKELDRIVPYEELALRVLGFADHRSIRHLNVIAHRLRRKLGDMRPLLIKTVRGRGYGLLLEAGNA